MPVRTDHEQKEWLQGARNAKAGISLTKSYKHIDRYNHDLRSANRAGWLAMMDYQNLKEIFESA
jgi:hypothetical protein